METTSSGYRILNHAAAVAEATMKFHGDQRLTYERSKCKALWDLVAKANSKDRTERLLRELDQTIERIAQLGYLRR